jgi:anti-sigma B factor antagonist
MVASGPGEHAPRQYVVQGASGGEQASFFCEGMDGCTVVFAVGEIDLAVSPVMREVMTEAVESCRHVIVDLSAVSFLDSTGLSVLLGTHKTVAAARRSMSLAGPCGVVAKVLRITRIDEAIPVHPDLDTALSATHPG